MTDPAAAKSPTRDCRQGLHKRCIMPESCGCPCHHAVAPTVPKPALTPVPDPPARGAPNAAGKYKPVIALEWEEPRRPLRPKTIELIEAFIPELKRHPGRWAKVASYAKGNSAAQASQNLRKAHPDLEVTARRTDDGGSAIYARARPEDEA